ncbi:probable G-protein coupled receptor 83 [Mizuhopecten yessoensis]|uniref:G-protein coupled receptor 83 n=1 Tax=Mizuhopecten yessoensis TaxID=6573 RepID=A0A210QHM7_MIZYE|nr:probable G-protein coupled receptor 83 [Mizuhopecten yessoensis]OWF48288.1 G-protein coupled receptor 83 [Mizuhopecten yessoensis]
MLEHLKSINRFLDMFRNRTTEFDFSNTTSTPWAERQSGDVFEKLILGFAYGILIVISFFGNSIVCYVILRNRRMYTVTNFFIANMAMSDLLLTLFNVPFNIAKHLLDNWPFGDVLCHFVNFSLMVSVYVSTFTLTAIALDRQNVLLKPLQPRMTKQMGLVVLVIIWLIAICFSLPYGIFNKVQSTSMVIKRVDRCSPHFPEPQELFAKYLTLITVVLQYIIPLSIISVAYGRIVMRLWKRVQLGAVTRTQQMSQARAKRKSIKLLVTVVVVFALCWMPLNLYHILTKFHPDVRTFTYDSTTFFVFHWIAISSTCYNPFVYCWLNESFRAEVKSCFSCCKRSRRVHPGIDVDGMLIRHDAFRRSKTITSVIRSSTTFSSIRITTNTSVHRDSYPFCVRDQTPLVNSQKFVSTEFSNVMCEDTSNG